MDKRMNAAEARKLMLESDTVLRRAYKLIADFAASGQASVEYYVKDVATEIVDKLRHELVSTGYKVEDILEDVFVNEYASKTVLTALRISW